MPENLSPSQDHVPGIIPTVGNAVRDIKHQTIESAGEIGKVVRTEARALEQTATGSAEEIASAAQGAVGQVHSAVNTRLREARQQTQDIQIRVADYVRTNPLKAVLCAFGAGMLIGGISRR